VRHNYRLGAWSERTEIKKETKSFGLGAACGIVRPKGDGQEGLCPLRQKSTTQAAGDTDQKESSLFYRSE